MKTNAKTIAASTVAASTEAKEITVSGPSETPIVQTEAKAEVCTVLHGVQLSESDSLALAKLLKMLQDSKSWAGRKQFQRSSELKPTATGFNKLTKYRLEDGASKEERAKCKLIQSMYQAFGACQVIEGKDKPIVQTLANAKTMSLLEG